jgi:hypothetical protein
MTTTTTTQTAATLARVEFCPTSQTFLKETPYTLVGTHDNGGATLSRGGEGDAPFSVSATILQAEFAVPDSAAHWELRRRALRAGARRLQEELCERADVLEQVRAMLQLLGRN